MSAAEPALAPARKDDPEGLVLVIRSVVVGMAVALAGTVPRNAFYAANLRIATGVPWAVPVTAAYLWLFWRYLRGEGPPRSTSELRRRSLRARRVSSRVWLWSLLAGGLGIVALVLALRLVNTMVALPVQPLPDLTGVPRSTVAVLLVAAAPIAGVIEEAAFRGYLQGPIERRYGLGPAILVTGTMFGVAHLDFTPILWPYYLAVALIYGLVTSLADSILPAMVLHSAGNVYSNLDLWLHGQAEWQAPADGVSGGGSGWATGALLAVAIAASVVGFLGLARSAARDRHVRRELEAEAVAVDEGR